MYGALDPDHRFRPKPFDEFSDNGNEEQLG